MMTDKEQETSISLPSGMQLRRISDVCSVIKSGFGTHEGRPKCCFSVVLGSGEKRMSVGRSHKVMLNGHVVKRSWLSYHFLNISCMQPIYSDIHTYHMYTILLDLKPPASGCTIH